MDFLVLIDDEFRKRIKSDLGEKSSANYMLLRSAVSV